MYDVHTILRVLPQRYPFLMVDRILEHRLGEYARCLKNVTFGEEVLTGHFPGHPVYPEVMLLEMALQASLIALTDLDTTESDANRGRTQRVLDFVFERAVLPGDQLLVTSEIDRSETTATSAVARVAITDLACEPVARGTIRLSRGAP